MSTHTNTDLRLRRIERPTDEELEAMLKVMTKGFESEPFAIHFPHPGPSVIRASHMSKLGPALSQGHLWVAELDGEMQGLAIWSEPGCLLGETEEGRRYIDEYTGMLSTEEAEWQKNVKKRVTAERETDLPGLWRGTFHLHVLVTIPSARGTGVGSALVRQFKQEAEGAGKGMSLSTPTESNVRHMNSVCSVLAGKVADKVTKRRFYERQGFKTVWEREMVYPNGDKEPYIVLTRGV